MKDINYLTDENCKITIPSTSKITNPNAFIFKENGKEICKVSATYDVKDLPPENVEMFIRMINKTTNIHLCLNETIIQIRKKVIKEKKKWWRKK